MHFPLRAIHILTILLVCSALIQFSAAEGDQQQQQASSEYTDDNDFRDTILNVTNTYRKQHNATALRWNQSLADGAEKWSKRCVFEHSGGPTGENLSSGYANASASIVAWGHERVDYDFKKGEFSHETGHFTQLVWKATDSVGCGRTECDGKGGDEAPGWFVVCNYYPAGNVVGLFTENVQAEVPVDQQPEGPSDPEVPQDEGRKECPQGGVCGAAEKMGARRRDVIGIACLVAMFGIWVV